MPWAEPTRNGLKVWLSGLIFVSTKISMEAYLHLEDESGIVYRFTPVRREREISDSISQAPSKSGGSPSYLHPYYGLVAFMLNSTEPNMSEAGLRHQGLLVEIHRSKPEFISTRKLCNGYCMRQSSEFENGGLRTSSEYELSSRNRAGSKNLSKTSLPIAAKWTNPNTCWVVD
jgi:hypothetical protein